MLPARVRTLVFLLLLTCTTLPAFAQQAGSIGGKVSDTGGGVLPGVTVEARSDVLPGPRATTTGADGAYQLPQLPPGDYTVSFSLQGMQTVTRKVHVQLAEAVALDAAMGVGGVSESVTVTAESPLIDKASASIVSGIPNDQISKLPVGQEYRDLIKLIPGVQYTQDSTRGPSSGSSGQDNVYKFDGVNVTLPLFGTLASEPASHDIAQVTVVKGGAKATDFNRAGGFAIDSVSKSGSSHYSGLAGFQFQTDNMAASLDNGSISRYEQNRYWTDLNVGGPIVKDHAYFYGSYYRPDVNRANRANAYGDLPEYQSTRNEGFIKGTVTPTRQTLANVSYRDSKRDDTSSLFGQFTAPTAGTGNESRQKIGTADGSWIINDKSYLNFKYTHFTLLTAGIPDNTAAATASQVIGTHLDVANLDKMGLLTVPKIGTNAAVNTFIAPLVNRYGYPCTSDLVASGTCSLAGAPAGGGLVGVGTTFDRDNFFRDAGQIGYNITLSTGPLRHNLHAGYMQSVDSEDLTRSSNGWGSITVPGGGTSFQGTPIFYLAAFQQQGIGAVPTIHSEFRSKSIEFNDTIAVKNWTFNVGVLDSNDTLYGQGLNNANTISGYVLATGTTSDARQYKMYDVPWSKLIQPRLSATWAYNGRDTVFASYAKFNPMASSLPRAASWDRNLAVTIQSYFDANGNLFANDPVAASSGKLFVPNMTPPTHNEFLVGTARELNKHLTVRGYFRYNRGDHYWEDTNNTARLSQAAGGFNPPATLPGTDASVPQTLYVPDLTAYRTQIGSTLTPPALSGSTYVIAELDGAFTRYREFTAETDYRSSKGFLRASYTKSQYYGNFDQDNSTVTTSNDANIFIGSSNIGDGPGRQLWDFKLGTLRGDRPNAFKIFGAYFLPWNASAGGYAIAQSGQPWEKWDYTLYSQFTTSVSETIKYAEPAGSHRAPTHYQLDTNYTQNLTFMKRYSAQIAVDAFNLFNKQTGYNIEPRIHAAGYGTPTSFFDPRRVQIAFRFTF